MFKPITSKLDTPVTVETPKVARKKSRKAIDYYPEVDPYEEMDIEGLVDGGFFSQQIPEDPPAYSPGKYMKLKQQRALEEKEIFEKYGLPIIETQETPKEALEAYNSVVKELGKEKRKLTNAINKSVDSSEKENLKKNKRTAAKRQLCNYRKKRQTIKKRPVKDLG